MNGAHERVEARMMRGGSGHRCLLALGVVLWTLWTGPPVWAGPPSEQLKAAIDQILQILEDPSLRSESRATERHAAVRKVAGDAFDFRETAKRALGPHWRKLDANDQQEFVRLFADLLERAYISKIDRYSGEKITFAGDSVEGELATVRTRFNTKQGAEIPVDYRMLRHADDRWLVYDVSVEGVSLVNNYRTQFNRIIQTASYQELVEKMKTSELAAPAGTPKRGGAPPRS